MPSESPSPFVYWAQDADNIFLKVDLKDIKNKEISLQDDEVHMNAYGIGAHGLTNYAFNLQLFDSVQSSDDVSQHIKISDRAVQFTLKKQENRWWPRLIKTQQKPAWLKIDFERWKSEDDDEGSDSGYHRNGTAAKDVLGDYPDLYEKLKKDEFGYMKEDYRKVYLVFYNLSQFVFFTYILVVMIIRYAKEGPDSMAGTYVAVGPVFKFCQLMQFLEVMHPMFGYTKGSVLIPFLQVTGRALILFAMVDAEPRMQTKPVVFYMFFIWALVEVVRYPYYIGQVYKINIGFLTWLRYSVWIPLYPLGILCEGIIILRNIPYFEETGRFSVSMPNKWNFTFHCPTVMKLYLLVLFVPGMYAMMTHMYKARMKKLGPKKWRSKFE